MTTWQRIFIRAAGFGVGCVVTIIIAIALWSYFSSRPTKPKPWNESAILAEFSEITVNTGDKIVAHFRYLVENTTEYDYSLPSDGEAAFIKLPETKGLTKDHDIAWDVGTFVPTGQKVAINFRLTYDYSEYSFPKSDIDNIEKFSKFMNRRLSEVDGFVILDKENRYQIDFHRGWKDDKTKVSKTD